MTNPMKADQRTADAFATSWNNLPEGSVYTPDQVAEFLGPRMEKRTHTIALVTAELTHLARAGWATDSLTFVLADETSVTVRP